jgi:TM2 domain-containing membrane protein YozV/rRNA maturation protein Nop10
MSATMKTCPSCGESIFQAAETCPHCGTRQASTPAPHQAAPVPPQYYAPEPAKNKMVAGLLALFLGGIGAHHFYLGNIGMGILYLVFSWTFIPMLAGFIEGIMYLTTSDAKWIAKYPPGS